MLKKEFGVSVSGLSVSLHLRKRGLSYQKPSYRDVARDEQEVEHFVKDTFPRIHRGPFWNRRPERPTRRDVGSLQMMRCQETCHNRSEGRRHREAPTSLVRLACT
jgi:hypothetical protein